VSFSFRGRFRITAWGGPDDGAVLGEAAGIEITRATELWPGYAEELMDLVHSTAYTPADAEAAARLLHSDGVPETEIFPLLHKLCCMGICTFHAVQVLCSELAVFDGS